MSETAPNICAGGFGSIYDFCIERPWLMARVSRALWGIDVSPLYRSITQIGTAAHITILDVPCGGGVALRALKSHQDVRYIAADFSQDDQSGQTACTQALALDRSNSWSRT